MTSRRDPVRTLALPGSGISGPVGNPFGVSQICFVTEPNTTMLPLVSWRDFHGGVTMPFVFLLDLMTRPSRSVQIRFSGFHQCPTQRAP
jgi:hypothetical protein